jgi:DMSO/TMAO reductase YedYZ molybdopterin-dependent catalytic subunit
MSLATVVADLHCAKGWTKRGNCWQGIRASDVLARHPPAEEARSVLAYAEYGYASTVRIEDLMHPMSLLATHLGGVPLTPAHGFPVRLVLPHLYSWKGPKWFRGWDYTATPQRGFWAQRGYHVIGEVASGLRYSYLE